MFNKSIIVLAAGAGTRMKSDTPKVLHKISGKPMLYYSIKEALKLSDDIKIFNKEDSYITKDKKQENTITKFHFVNNLSKYNKDFIKNILN